MKELSQSRYCIDIAVGSGITAAQLAEMLFEMRAVKDIQEIENAWILEELING